MPVALLHAYRSANRGDGWLVGLSRQLVQEATGSEPIVYALDPAGMGPAARAVLPPPQKVRAAAAASLSANRHTSRLAARVMDLPDPADLRAAIGVGGGYLRSADPVHEAVFRAHHLPQLRLIARMGVRGAYLPISVGPFRRGLGRLVRRELASVGWVAARDDRSARYLAGWGGGWRMPDLAACRIGVDRPALQPGEPGVIGVVLRSLPRSDLGFASVSILEERGLKVRYGLQSSSGRTNDDRSLYAAHGVLDEADDFGTMLASSPRPSAILAGRLHAALDAIAAGIPAIHVGYERKSLGAFSDLGLADYVIDAWTGVPGDLADRIVELAADPEPYWERLWNRFDPLADRWAQLVEGVSRLLSAPAARRGWR